MIIFIYNKPQNTINALLLEADAAVWERGRVTQFWEAITERCFRMTITTLRDQSAG